MRWTISVDKNNGADFFFNHGTWNIQLKDPNWPKYEKLY